MKIDDIDIAILSELQNDSRLSIRELSKKVNLSAPSVAERIRKMEFNGVIEGYTIRVNKKNLGLKIKCVIEITTKNFNYELSPDYIVNHPRCETCYRIAGDSSYIAILSVSSLEEIEDFVMHVAPFGTTKTKFVFGEVAINQDIKKFLK